MDMLSHLTKPIFAALHILKGICCNYSSHILQADKDSTMLADNVSQIALKLNSRKNVKFKDNSYLELFYLPKALNSCPKICRQCSLMDDATYSALVKEQSKCLLSTPNLLTGEQKTDRVNADGRKQNNCGDLPFQISC